MKGLLLAMATGQVNTDYQAQNMHRPVQLRPAVRFTQVSQYQGRHLVGEKYLLHNAGTEPITLTEQEFDRDDAAVTGVAIEQHTVAPGASTTVYVMRRGSAP
jgi:conjugal transfer pilus assembly protein TraK